MDQRIAPLDYSPERPFAGPFIPVVGPTAPKLKSPPRPPGVEDNMRGDGPIQPPVFSPFTIAHPAPNKPLPSPPKPPAGELVR